MDAHAGKSPCPLGSHGSSSTMPWVGGRKLITSFPDDPSDREGSRRSTSWAVFRPREHRGRSIPTAPLSCAGPTRQPDESDSRIDHGTRPPTVPNQSCERGAEAPMKRLLSHRHAFMRGLIVSALIGGAVHAAVPSADG